MAYGASANDLRSRATRLRNSEISVAGKGLKRYPGQERYPRPTRTVGAYGFNAGVLVVSYALRYVLRTVICILYPRRAPLSYRLQYQ